MRRNITAVNLDFTTRCNRRCVDCCANVAHREVTDYGLEYFQQAAKWLYGIPRVNLTGGEPTSHPLFAELVPRLKPIFGCKTLILCTNGYRVIEHVKVLPTFDLFYLSIYDERGWEIADWLKARFGDRVSASMPQHIPRCSIGQGNICFRGTTDTVAYADGKFFSCCVAPGIPSADFIEPSSSWREEIQSLPAPCDKCWFS